VRAREPGRVELSRGGRQFDVDVAVHAEAGGRPVLTLVFTDVTTRTEREALAVATANELRSLNEQKDDFIASVSHELRTPVTSILGFAEQLEESTLNERDRQATRIIARNARRLADVIQDVLELSKLSSIGAPSRAASSVDLVEMIHHCAEDAAGFNPARRVSFALDLPENAVRVMTVPQDVSRVCANLLSNAVKFSPVDGTVRISLAERADDIEVRLSDDGPGIPPHELPLIWERFYRVQSDRHRGVPGTGLGLPIVKGLIENRIGGSIDIESDGQSGTTVIMRIPREHPTIVPVRGNTEREA